MSLHYLTVQDVLWINLQVTKRVNRFNYARLEEATYYQYAYGESRSLVPQAARYLGGFLKMAPFDSGNEATAFVGCLAFLVVNGMELCLEDAKGAAWFEDVRSARVKALDAINAIARPVEHAHHDVQPPIRARIVEVLNSFPETISALASVTTPV